MKSFIMEQIQWKDWNSRRAYSFQDESRTCAFQSKQMLCTRYSIGIKCAIKVMSVLF